MIHVYYCFNQQEAEDLARIVVTRGESAIFHLPSEWVAENVTLPEVWLPYRCGVPLPSRGSQAEAERAIRA